MRVERFLDTNILLYGYDRDAGSKRLVAQSLIERGWTEPGRTAISVQVLQEFQVNFVRAGHPQSEAETLIADFTIWPVVDNTLEVFRAGLSEQRRWQITLWDAMIVAAARASGARELYTEDLNHGQSYDGLMVINPFV